MNGQDAFRLLCLPFLLVFVLEYGCSAPNIKLPEAFPPIVKEYKHVTLRGGTVGMQNTGIYLEEGETYSILATGSIDLWSGLGAPPGYEYHDVRPEQGWPFMVRIGNNFRFSPLQDVNGRTFSAHESGYLYVGHRDGEVDLYGDPLNPEYYKDDAGSFSVDIIVWERDDYVQISDFFEKMKEKDPNNEAIIDAFYEANRHKEIYLAEIRTSEDIAETKKKIQELKEEPEKEKEQISKAISDEKTVARAKPLTVEVKKQERVDQLEAKLAKLTETLAQLEEMKKQLKEEKARSSLLSAKLAKTIREKEALQVKLESEADVKRRLEESLEERELALKRQEALVASLYEKERQLNSKLFQLEQAQRKFEENRKELERLKIRSEELNKELRRTKSDETSEVAKRELDGVIQEKLRLEKKAKDLKEKQSRLSAEVLELRALADKTRLEAERAKEELAAKQKREGELTREVEELKRRLDRGIAPVLVISRPKDGSKSDSPNIILNVIIVDDRGIDDVHIYLNDNALKLDLERGIKLGARKSPKKMDITERLQLEYGENTIKVWVRDTDAMTAEEVVKVTREKEHGKIWAIVIGINEYENTRNLKYAVNDAKAFKLYLEEYLGIMDENVFLLTDQRATKLEIESLLGTKIRRKAGKEDTVIIFYAGHGAAETDPVDPDGDGYEKYLLPCDARLDDLYSTSISMEDIKTIFQRIRADRLIFIADTCYSGASGGRTMITSRARATLSEEFFERISQGKGRVIISACSANEISKEDDQLKHGIFSYYLLEGLKGGADNDGDGIITVSELFSYLSRKVPEASGQDQHPVRKGETEGELVIGMIK